MASPPKYITGDKAAINEFIDKFDVRQFPPPYYALPAPPVLATTSNPFILHDN